MMTPCEEKGYEVGQIFEVESDSSFSDDAIVVLSVDDGSRQPKFDLVIGSCVHENGILTVDGAFANLSNVKRIYPPESEAKTVSVTCEGKVTEISRESARTLNLL